ncbi:MAG: hypothetical protein AAFX93_05090 [Verrucomicrobiota bacterium]
MKFFKQNPVFSAILSLFVVLFIAGLVFIFLLNGQVAKEQKDVKRAESNLRAALSLQPAPTDENIQAAEKNISELKQVLEKQIAATAGNKPNLLSSNPPATGTDLFFQLQSYRDELTQDAERTVPINVSDEELEVMEEFGTEVPGVEIPEGFAFGFSRYIDSGEPPADSAVPVLFKQKEILTYALRKLLSTRPISIVSVDRSPLELPKPKSKDERQQLNADEFNVGSESAAVKSAVETIPFRIVFTGYTENLRSFLKQIEEFEIPLVVRSVEVTPLEDSVVTADNSRGGRGNSVDDLFGGFGSATPESDAEPAAPAKDPIVAENESEFTVVIEYITVTVAGKDSKKEDLS